MNSMQVRQKGIGVFLYRLGGGAFLLLAGLAIISGLVSFISSLFSNGFMQAVSVAILTVVVTSPFACIGLLWFLRFPNIRITDRGVVSEIAFFHHQYLWADIVALANTKGLIKYKAIVLHKGSIANWMYGLEGGLQRPVILISLRSEGLSALEEIASERIVSTKPSR